MAEFLGQWWVKPLKLSKVFEINLPLTMFIREGTLEKFKAYESIQILFTKLNII